MFIFLITELFWQLFNKLKVFHCSHKYSMYNINNISLVYDLRFNIFDKTFQEIDGSISVIVPYKISPDSNETSVLISFSSSFTFCIINVSLYSVLSHEMNSSSYSCKLSELFLSCVFI